MEIIHWKNDMTDVLPLSQLAAFEASARFRSFTAAARALNVQQPAISRQVAALELRLGGPLFLRTKPKLTLTANGEALFRAVSGGFQSIRTEIRRLEASRRAAPVVVNVSIGFASLYLMPRLGDFHARHPEHSVQIVTRDQNAGFDEAAADIVITFGETALPEAQSAVIVREQLAPICAPGVIPDDAPLPLEVLPEQKLLHMSSEDHFDDWARYFEGSGLSAPPPKLTDRIMSYMVYLVAIQDGQGIGLGWRGLIEKMLESGGLVLASARIVETNRAYRANLMPRASHSAGAHAFWRWLARPGAG